MTFEFNTATGLLFFLCFGLALLISTSDFKPPNQRTEGCMLHPGVSDCVHRSKKK